MTNELKAFPTPEPIEENSNEQTRGIQLQELPKLQSLEMDRSTGKMLELVLNQNPHLSHIEVVFISPEDEPNTGGIFRRVQIDEQTYIPTIFIVSKNQEHMSRLKQTRQKSAARVAELLGIDFAELSPELLRQFIIAHELGHASDYVKNYETNPDFHGSDAVEEWELHYEANLLTMPVPGLDPVELREVLSQFDNLEDFLESNPNLKNTINTNEIKNLQDLINLQETTYRNSEYERYADNFATKFLQENSADLNIPELMDQDKYKKAA